MEIKPFTIEFQKQQETKDGKKDVLIIKVYKDNVNYNYRAVVLEEYTLETLMEHINTTFKDFIVEQSK
jgi:hypothetical protein